MTGSRLPQDPKAADIQSLARSSGSQHDTNGAIQSTTPCHSRSARVTQFLSLAKLTSIRDRFATIPLARLRLPFARIVFFNASVG